MSKTTVSKERARAFLVQYHGLAFDKAYIGEDAVEYWVNQVGCVQYDPLDVVGRNPDLVLQSRIDGYTKAQLEHCLYRSRTLVDGWDKMMAIYPSKDWPHYRRVRAARTAENLRILSHRGTQRALDYLADVKAILENSGAQLAREIEIGGASDGVWQSGKFANVALDHLFHMGALGVAKKKNTQKVYDIIERLLPQSVLEAEDPFESEDAFYKWYILRRIGGIGLLWLRNGGGWLGHYVSDKKLRTRIVGELVASGALKEVWVEGIDEPFYTRAQDRVLLETCPIDCGQSVRFMAPLDNLIWDRGLIEKLFHFKYTWEVYVPKHKRQYGYYVLPVLEGNRFIGRFEPIKQRGAEPLAIANWWWEDGVQPTSERLEAIEKAFEDFARYLGAEGGVAACMAVVRRATIKS